MARSWTEDDLIAGIASGDEDACSAFDNRFRPRLLHFARRRGLHWEDAEDVVQDTLVAAVQHLRARTFGRRATLATWVLSIFHRRCADTQRTQIRRRRSVIAADGMEAAMQVRLAPDGDVQMRVRLALASLPPRERLVLLLNAQQGLKAREIAPLLGLGVKSAEGLLTRAKKEFRRAIGSHQETAPRGRLNE